MMFAPFPEVDCFSFYSFIVHTGTLIVVFLFLTALVNCWCFLFFLFSQFSPLLRTTGGPRQKEAPGTTGGPTNRRRPGQQEGPGTTGGACDNRRHPRTAGGTWDNRRRWDNRSAQDNRRQPGQLRLQFVSGLCLFMFYTRWHGDLLHR